MHLRDDTPLHVPRKPSQTEVHSLTLCQHNSSSLQDYTSNKCPPQQLSKHSTSPKPTPQCSALVTSTHPSTHTHNNPTTQRHTHTYVHMYTYKLQSMYRRYLCMYVYTGLDECLLSRTFTYMSTHILDLILYCTYISHRNYIYIKHSHRHSYGPNSSKHPILDKDRVL